MGVVAGVVAGAVAELPPAGVELLPAGASALGGLRTGCPAMLTMLPRLTRVRLPAASITSRNPSPDMFLVASDPCT